MHFSLGRETADQRPASRSIGNVLGSKILVTVTLALTGLAILAGCSGQASSHRVATGDMHMSVVAIRHNDYLLVQVTLAKLDSLDERIELRNGDRIDATLNGRQYPLEAQWNGVYSSQIPYSEGNLRVRLQRRDNRPSAVTTQLNLPVSPEFHSPAPNALFHTQSHNTIPLGWTGIATENGQYELRCTNRNHGVAQYTGTFAAQDRQRVNIPVTDLMNDIIENNRRGFCEAAFTLRGISTAGRIDPALGGGDLLFESNVSRNVIIRHNALF